MCFFTRFDSASRRIPAWLCLRGCGTSGDRCGRGPVRATSPHQAPERPASPPRLAWGLALAPSLNGPRVRGRSAEKAGAWARVGLGPGRPPRRLERSGGCGSMEDEAGRGPRAARETRAPRASCARRAAGGRRSGSSRAPGGEEAEAVGGAGLVPAPRAPAACAWREILKDFGESQNF